MIDLILDSPIWLIAILAVGGFGGVGVGFVFLLRPLVKRHHDDEHNSVFSDGFAAVATVYAIIAGLLVFAVFNTFDSASDATSDEASAIVLMYRNAHEFPQAEQEAAQKAIREYTSSVIQDEWPTLAYGERSEKTSEALGNMYRTLGPMAPTPAWSDQYRQAYDNLNNVVTLRNARVENSGSTLSPIYWILVLGGALLVMAYLALETVGSRFMHCVAVGLMGAFLGTVVFLLAEVSQPFRGTVSIAPDNFQNAVATMDDVDRGG